MFHGNHRLLKKTAVFFAAAGLSVLALSTTAMAASKEKIGKISLTISSDIRRGYSGGEVDVTPTGDNTGLYYVDYVEVLNDEGENWTSSNPPEVSILLGLENEEEYAFSGTSSSNFKLSLAPSIKNRFDLVKFLDAKKQDGGALMEITVRLVFDKDADIRTVESPANAYWSGDGSGIAYWDEVDDAKYYQVQLMKDGTAIGSVENIYGGSLDFSSQLTADGSYQFRVRSVRSTNSSKSGWKTSTTLKRANGQNSGGAQTQNGQTTSAGPGALVPTGSWQLAADGQRWWWDNGNGSYPASQWKDINGQWYYFDAQGYMATGWVTVNNASYYLDPASGAMYANRRTPDNYWVGPDGAWVPGV